MMHVNWLMPLGGDLTGTLPNPSLSASSFLRAQVFGARQASGALPDSSFIERQVFGPRQIAQVSLDDSQSVQIGQAFGGRQGPVFNGLLFNNLTLHEETTGFTISGGGRTLTLDANLTASSLSITAAIVAARVSMRV